MLSVGMCAKGGFCRFVNSEIPMRRQNCVQRTCNPYAESHLLLHEILPVSFGEVVVILIFQNDSRLLEMDKKRLALCYEKSNTVVLECIPKYCVIILFIYHDIL